MRLAAVQLTEFKSINDSNEFPVGDVTCLVGKNEAGKTSLLQALYRLNPVVPEHATYNLVKEYPAARVEHYRREVAAGKRGQATVARAQYALDDDEVEAIEALFGEGVVGEAPQLALSKGYDGELRVELALDHARVVANFIAAAELPEGVEEAVRGARDVSALAAMLEADSKAREKSSSSAAAKANALADEAKKASALAKAEAIKESVEAAALRRKLSAFLERNVELTVWDNVLKQRWPKFLYFDEFYQMAGAVNIQALKTRQESNSLIDSDRPMLGLIDLAGLDIDQLLGATETQDLKSRLQGAGNFLSQTVLKYWSQNKHIRLQFDLREGKSGDPEGLRNGPNLWAEVHDTAHWVTLPVGTRSRGFIWFFSFLAWFSQQSKAEIPVILLLDEPGLFLHAQAQRDLLDYVDEELKDHQVIYTTHSPFMIDARRFDRVRLVRDRSMEEDRPLPVPEAGTKVLTDVLHADAGTLFPLQGALAYDITQTLFVGPNPLLVEGVSELVYLPTLGDVLRDAGRVGLDPRWTIAPVGGADKAASFVALFQAQKGLNVATLLDIQKKDEQNIEKLKARVRSAAHVLTFADFTAAREADVEDMFDPAFYLELFNRAYAGVLPAPVTLAQLPQHPRIVVRIGEHLKTNPMGQNSGFNHFKVARYLAENVDELRGNIDTATLDRFEAAFKALNALL